MNKAGLFLKRNSSNILTVIAAGGVVGTSILAVKATPKALTLINNAEEEKGDKLTVKETVMVAWKPYIPAAITGLSTIACIFGVNHLNRKTQASLMSAYALLDSTYKEYRNKTEEIYGEDANIKIRNEIIKAKYNNEEIEDGKLLFWDFHSMRYFQRTMNEVLEAESQFLEALEYRGYACLNEYYTMLGLPMVEYGFQQGWYDVENNDPYNCHPLEFTYERVLINNDLECWIISTNMPPSLDYIL